MIYAKVAGTKLELVDVYHVRHVVFNGEQGVPEEIEVDEKESESTHFIVYNNSRPIGAGRLRFEGSTAKAERVCVVSELRGQGIGALLMKKMEDVSREKGMTLLLLHAQVHAESFYKGIGYKTLSKPFYEADILHVTMEKKL